MHRYSLSLCLGALLLAGGPVSAQVVEYYHLDGLGNVRAVTDASGNVTERHDYLPFGEECTTGPCAANPRVGAGLPRKFTGKERDAETGLDYFGARYYGSKIGRFTSVDPALNLRASLLDPQRFNRYSGSLNNPVRFSDPDGREVPVAVDGRLFNMGLEGAPPMSRQEAVLAAAIYGSGLAVGLAPVVPYIPAMWAEVQIAIGTCLPSAACQNAVRGGIEGASGAPSGAMGTLPTLTGTSGRELYRQAVGHAKALQGTAAQKAGLFERLSAEIAERTSGAWVSNRVGADDGAQIFVGRAGEALVIDPAGKLFRGRVGEGISATGGGFTVDYGALKALEQ